MNGEGLSTWQCLTIAGILVQYVGNDRPILSISIFFSNVKTNLRDMYTPCM